MKRAKKRPPLLLRRFFAVPRTMSRAINRAVASVSVSNRKTARRKKEYALRDLLAQMPNGFPMDEEMRTWDQMEPVGSEFGAVEIWEEDGEFVARCNDPEVASEGRTEEEALANLREALSLYYEGQNKDAYIDLAHRVSQLEDRVRSHGIMLNEAAAQVSAISRGRIGVAKDQVEVPEDIDARNDEVKCLFTNGDHDWQRDGQTLTAVRWTCSKCGVTRLL